LNGLIGRHRQTDGKTGQDKKKEQAARTTWIGSVIFFPQRKQSDFLTTQAENHPIPITSQTMGVSLESTYLTGYCVL